MSYDLFIEPDVHEMRKQLPGNIRQRIKRILDDLSADPRPPTSRQLTLSGTDLGDAIQIWRIRLEHWRIIYAINDTDRWVRVCAIRRRPPYAYEDIPSLLRRLAE